MVLLADFWDLQKFGGLQCRHAACEKQFSFGVFFFLLHLILRRRSAAFPSCGPRHTGNGHHIVMCLIFLVATQGLEKLIARYNFIFQKRGNAYGLR